MKSQQNIIGLHLKKLRKIKKLSQSVLAARCGALGWNISENTITKIEAQIRCVTDKELIILASALHIKMKDVFPNYPRLF